ncbi:MAG TPA: hypothetical protein ENJ31_05640, partial [Anaerolineae bacterium]|nr:hypothetical protein [Anaerolineae bacterium]
MKGSKIWHILMAAALALSLLPGVAAAAPPQEPPKPPEPAPSPGVSPPMGPTASFRPNDIGSSSVTDVSPDPIPRKTLDLCFTVNVSSPDSEFMDALSITLPLTWTINTVFSNSIPAADGGGFCPGALPPVSGSTGNVVWWHSNGYPPQTGCGAWAGGSYDFCVNVTVPSSSGSPWLFPWEIVGDGSGNSPHSVSGVYGPVDYQPPLTLLPTIQYFEGCAYETQHHTLTIYNSIDVTMTVGLVYTVTGGPGLCTGPVTTTVPPSSTQDINIEFTPGGAPGDNVGCEIYAEDQADPANHDTAWIAKSLVASTWVWNPENIDLGPMPDTLWGSGDGVVMGPTAPQFWNVAGIDHTGNVTDTAYYYDFGLGTWQYGGNVISATYRTEADVQQNMIYNVGGSRNGGFYPVSTTQHYTGGLWVKDSPAPVSWMDPVEEVWPAAYGGNDHTYLVGGYVSAGSGGNQAYEYDPVADTWTAHAAHAFDTINYPVDGCFGWTDGSGGNDPV